MNTPFMLAQASPLIAGPSSAARVVELTKPPSNQAVTILLDGPVRLDFSRIATENITLVPVGNKLVVLFDNQTTITLEPVFGSDGQPLANVSFELAPDRIVSGAEFATLFPITTDPSVLPAAGSAGGSSSGADFRDHAPVEALGDGRDALALLGGETIGAIEFSRIAPPPPNLGTLPVIGSPDALTVDDGALSDGNLDSGGSPGDVPGAPASATGSLHVNFGNDAAGRSLAFGAAQPGLAGLFSGGLPIAIEIGTSGGLPAIIGHTGNAADPVFVITLDAGPLDGAYTFTLFKALDHPIQGAEDSLLLPISFVAIDGNSDTAAGTFTVTINDDSPSVEDVAASMGENDNVIIDLGGHFSFGADHGGTTPIVLGTATLTGVPGDLALGLPVIQLIGQTVQIVPGTAFDALSLGEQVTLHIPYTVTDGDGDAVTEDIVVTVNGADDAPTGAAASNGENLGGQSAGLLVLSGELAASLALAPMLDGATVYDALLDYAGGAGEDLPSDSIGDANGTADAGSDPFNGRAGDLASILDLDTGVSGDILDGDMRVQSNPSGPIWHDGAASRDTGSSFMAGNEVIKMMLDAAQTQAHV